MSSDGASNVDTNLYGYTPTRSVCYVFVVLFAITSLLHLWQAMRSRAWWLFPTVVIAAIAEVIGWVARTQGSYDPTKRQTFIIQTTVLVLAPTPFVAALFVGFGRITARLGSDYSRLRPVFYSRVFLTLDVISIMVQGAGGGMAASAQDPDKIRLGSNVILGGLIIQIASMTIFCFLMAEYAWRRAGDRPYHKTSYTESAEKMPMDRHVKMLIAGICITTAFTYVRCIFRVIEFADGFNGTIAHTEMLFNVFDGMMITLAMYTLNFMHPGLLLRAMQHTPNYPLGRMGSV
ncbi:RTA1-domain-containing protein [Daedaleopsis nitida]|nr:RTA1-domain-containing protein [Daedaleopsis nitida]